MHEGSTSFANDQKFLFATFGTPPTESTNIDCMHVARRHGLLKVERAVDILVMHKGNFGPNTKPGEAISLEELLADLQNNDPRAMGEKTMLGRLSNASH